MKKKLVFLAMLAMVLAFGMAVAGCSKCHVGGKCWVTVSNHKITGSSDGGDGCGSPGCIVNTIKDSIDYYSGTTSYNDGTYDCDCH